MDRFLNTSLHRIHLVGIGGVGMSGIAEILHRRGYAVSGSDLVKSSPTVKRLCSFGIPVFQHKNAHTAAVSANLIVYSSAVSQTQPELVAARNYGIPLVSRGQMLAELMQGYCRIAVAGTHGKTSTVGLMAQLFLQSSLDPTVVLGGYLNSIKSHAYQGESIYFLTEADESDASLLLLKPEIAVITNIDKDHLNTYGGDFNQLVETYQQFLSPVASNHLLGSEKGWAVLCQDDPVLSNIIGTIEIERSVISYGLSETAMIRAIEVRQLDKYIEFKVLRDHFGKSPLLLKLHLAGMYSVLNALAVVAVATLLSISDEDIYLAFTQYTGVKRRFELLGEVTLPVGVVQVIDDYGHHPTEVEATLQAIHMRWPYRRVVIVFQPHRYTRTRDLLDEFATVFSKEAECLLLLPLYAAGEVAIEGVNSEALAEAIYQKGGVKPVLVNKDSLMLCLREHLKDNDVVLFQGAGDITQIAHAFKNLSFQN